MGSCLSKTARGAYAIILLLNVLWAVLCVKLVQILPMATRSRQNFCLRIVQLAWRMSLIFSPWMRISADQSFSRNTNILLEQLQRDDARRSKGEEVPPIFILGNHTSFLDTVLTVSKLPSTALSRARTYMSAGLFKLPLLSTLCRACGHFPVYFTSTELGKFQVDREKMAQVQLRVDEHLAAGGLLCFFPEGQINKKNPDELMTFRWGGMKKALANDARMYSFVTYGNQGMWPSKASVGGFPGVGMYSLRPLTAPDQGACSLVDELKGKENVDAEDPDHKILADHCRAQMQQQYDDLARACPPGAVTLRLGGAADQAKETKQA